MLRTRNLITDGSQVGYNNAALQINRSQKQKKDYLDNLMNEQIKLSNSFSNSL